MNQNAWNNNHAQRFYTYHREKSALLDKEIDEQVPENHATMTWKVVNDNKANEVPEFKEFHNEFGGIRHLLPGNENDCLDKRNE